MLAPQKVTLVKPAKLDTGEEDEKYEFQVRLCRLRLMCSDACEVVCVCQRRLAGARGWCAVAQSQRRRLGIFPSWYAACLPLYLCGSHAPRPLQAARVECPVVEWSKARENDRQGFYVLNVTYVVDRAVDTVQFQPWGYHCTPSNIFDQSMKQCVLFTLVGITQRMSSIGGQARPLFFHVRFSSLIFSCQVARTVHGVSSPFYSCQRLQKNFRQNRLKRQNRV